MNRVVDDYGSTAVPPDWIEPTGLATSRDLTSWTRASSPPVLPVRGAGAFDERFVSDPRVLRDGDCWVMFYFGLAADGHAREGYATSSDLRTRKKAPELLLDIGAAGSIDSVHAHKPSIVYWDSRLEHFYCAVSGQDGSESQARRGITRAISHRAASTRRRR